MLCAFGLRVAMYMCCDMLGVVGSNLTTFKLEPAIATLNMSQHMYIATRWPNAHSMLRQLNVSKCCVSMLRSFGRGFTLLIILSHKCNFTNLKENQYPMLPSSLHKTKKNTNQIFPTPKYNPQVCLKLILHAKKQVMSCDS